MRKLRCATIMAWSLMLAVPLVSNAQTTIFNSNGFEPPSYALGNLNGQQGFVAQGSAAAGTITNTTVYSGTQSFRINGPNLTAFGFNFSSSSFWTKTVAANLATSFKPVEAGQPILNVNWKQFITGSSGDIFNMPFSGIHIEGFRADGQAQMTTEIYYDLNDSISVFDGGGGIISGPSLSNSRNTWLDLSAQLNYVTQTLNISVNGASYLTDVPFANYIPSQLPSASIGIAETDFVAVSGQLQTGAVPNNVAFFDDFSVIATAVPEPTTYALGGLTILGALGAWRYRSKRNQKTMETEVQPVE